MKSKNEAEQLQKELRGLLRATVNAIQELLNAPSSAQQNELSSIEWYKNAHHRNLLVNELDDKFRHAANLISVEARMVQKDLELASHAVLRDVNKGLVK